MIRNPKVGMRVRILNRTTSQEFRGEKKEQVMDYNASLCDTGVITDIWSSHRFAHHQKWYTVTLDPPNWGAIDFYGTEHIEEVK